MAENQLAEPKSAEPPSDEIFWKITDKFIVYANELATANEIGVVNSGFLFAAARFNTFLVASQCGDKETFEAEKEAAIEYFVNQFKISLTEHIADYQSKFDIYMKGA